MSLPDRRCTPSLGRKCYRAFNDENAAKVRVILFGQCGRNVENKRVGETRDDLDCAQDFKSLTAKHILRFFPRGRSGHKDVLYTRPPAPGRS